MSLNHAISRNRWGFLLLFVVNVILLCQVAFPGESCGTETATVSWKYTAEQQKMIIGYRIYDENNKVIVDNVGPELRKTTFDYDEKKGNAWYIVAVTSEKVESDNSNIVVYVPELPEPIFIPAKPGTLLLLVPADQ